ncbi:MAG TPA: AAA family ATPase [Kofleriaceae bacterium]|nr:AAA family ATPase [Kofleriaceae bacterium]
MTARPYLDLGALIAEWLAVTRRYLDAAEGDAAAAEEARAAERALEERTAAALAHGVVLPIAWARRRLGLADTEERVLWVLIAHELCPETRHRLRALATEELADVTLDVLRRVVYGARADLRTWRELAPSGPLRRACLIESIGRGDGPAHRMTFRVARRVLALVHGDEAVDEELAGIAARAPDARSLDDLEADAEAKELAQGCLTRARGLAILHGGAGVGRRSLWLAAARAARRGVLVVDARALAPDRAAAERQLRIVAREGRLLGLLPLILHLDALAASDDAPDRLDLIDAELDGLVLATAERPPAHRWRRPHIAIDLPPLGGAARARLWHRALPAVHPGGAEVLAARYPLAPALIRTAAALATHMAGEAELAPAHVEAGVRAVVDGRLAGLAERVEVTRTWADLVLPEGAAAAIVELVARVRSRRRVLEDWGFAEEPGRGPGVAALFSGPPGTGKSTCAGLVARELGAALYRVDMRRIVPWYSGEAEAHVAALLDAAAAGHALLLFEEASALLGRREAPQTSCLLQRLERFTGVCILTTTDGGAIDDAVRRRLTVHVRFPMPGVEEREQLWHAMLPERAPKAGELRLDELARRYVMSGGQIQRAVLRAAFVAAEEDAAITAEHLAHAAQLEHEAAGAGTGAGAGAGAGGERVDEAAAAAP